MTITMSFLHPANSNALNNIQSGGMGEGWSDFYALMFTQRPTDLQNAAYPVGTYVLGQAPTGGGIRRRPYSFNMTTDPLTWDALDAGQTLTVATTTPAGGTGDPVNNLDPAIELYDPSNNLIGSDD